MLFNTLKWPISTILLLIVIAGCDLFKNSTDTPDYNVPDIPIINGTVEDIDGNVYTTVKIGSQEWTAENLRTTKLNDGTPIPLTGDSAWSDAGINGSPAYCYYDSNSSNKDKYGALYNWYAVKTGKLAPTGWHVPTDAEWTELEQYLIANGYNWDGSKKGNKIAKALAAKSDWEHHDVRGAIGDDLSKNNATGFSALPGGERYSVSGFYHIDRKCYWWSATEDGERGAWFRILSYDRGFLSKDFLRDGGLSVRLLKD